MESEPGERPRVLWITDEPPDRNLGGGNIRQAHLIEGLSRCVDVCLLVMGDLRDEHVRGAVGRVIEVQPVRLPEPRRKSVRRLFDLWLALGPTGPREVAITARRRRRLHRIVDSLEPGFDLVVANHLGMAALRRRHHRTQWAIQLHHVSSAMALQEGQVAPGRRQRWLLSREAAKARRFEAWAMRTFDIVISASDDDAELLLGGRTEAPGRRLVVSNGVDTASFSPSPLPSEPRIVMIGSFQYEPNVDGALWFCREVFPLVRRVRPEARLDLVGLSPRAEVRALAGQAGVSLHADVASVRPFLAAARLTVVPLRVGTGTRLKALESMAAGRPVVGTTIGLAGLGLVDRRHARIVDDPDGMAGAIVEVLSDDHHARALASSGRELVERRFEWSTIAEDMARELCASVTGEPAAASGGVVTDGRSLPVPGLERRGG